MPPVLSFLDKIAQREVPTIRSLLVGSSSRILHERHFAGGSPTRRMSIYSCTKSVLSMAVGALVREERFPDLDSPVLDVLPSLARDAHSSFGTVTLRHCLGMTLGYDLTFGDYDVEGTVARPLDHEPGTTFCYNDVAPQIVSRVVTAVTGASASAYANEAFLQRIGIRDAPWASDADGASIGGFGLKLTPHEMLAFGRFALARGMLDGAPRVDPGYFSRSVEPLSPGGPPGENPYGLSWWVSDRGGHRTHYAMGYGGQLVCVCPALDLVAVVACTHELGPHVGPSQDLYFEHVLPAVAKEA